MIGGSIRQPWGLQANGTAAHEAGGHLDDVMSEQKDTFAEVGDSTGPKATLAAACDRTCPTQIAPGAQQLLLPGRDSAADSVNLSGKEKGLAPSPEPTGSDESAAGLRPKEVLARAGSSARRSKGKTSMKGPGTQPAGIQLAQILPTIPGSQPVKTAPLSSTGSPIPTLFGQEEETEPSSGGVAVTRQSGPGVDSGERLMASTSSRGLPIGTDMNDSAAADNDAEANERSQQASGAQKEVPSQTLLTVSALTEGVSETSSAPGEQPNSRPASEPRTDGAATARPPGAPTPDGSSAPRPALISSIPADLPTVVPSVGRETGKSGAGPDPDTKPRQTPRVEGGAAVATPSVHPRPANVALSFEVHSSSPSPDGEGASATPGAVCPAATTSTSSSQTSGSAQVEAMLASPAPTSPLHSGDSAHNQRAPAEVPEQPLSSPPGALPSARVLERMNQSEIRVGLNSAEFGSLQLHTTVAGDRVGATVETAHSELRAAILAEMPSLHRAIEQRDLRLVTFELGPHGGGEQRGDGSPPQQQPSDPGTYNHRPAIHFSSDTPGDEVSSLNSGVPSTINVRV